MTIDWEHVPHGARLCVRRKKMIWAQGQLAWKVNTTAAVIGNWESGLSKPSLTAITDLAHALDCTADYLLCRVDDPVGHTVEKTTPKLQPMSVDPGVQSGHVDLRSSPGSEPAAESPMLDLLDTIVDRAFAAAGRAGLDARVLVGVRAELLSAEALVGFVEVYTAAAMHALGIGSATDEPQHDPDQLRELYEQYIAGGHTEEEPHGQGAPLSRITPSLNDPCPHPARSGVHELYGGVGKYSMHCRACGAAESRPTEKED